MLFQNKPRLWPSLVTKFHYEVPSDLRARYHAKTRGCPLDSYPKLAVGHPSSSSKNMLHFPYRNLVENLWTRPISKSHGRGHYSPSPTKKLAAAKAQPRRGYILTLNNFSSLVLHVLYCLENGAAVTCTSLASKLSTSVVI